MATGYEQAYQAFASGHHEYALDLLRSSLGDSPDDAGAWILEGRLRAALGEWQAAQRAMERACSIAPDNVFVFSEYAHFLHFEGELAASLGVIEQAEALAAPLDTRCELSLLKARVLLDLLQEHMMFALAGRDEDADGDPEGIEHSRTFHLTRAVFSAVDLYDSARPLVVPASAEMLSLLEEGERLLTELQHLRSDLHEVWDLKARYAVLGGRPKDAILAWKQALAIKPHFPRYLHDLGVTCEGVGELVGAKDAYKRLSEAERLRGTVSSQFTSEDFSALVQAVWEDLRSGLHVALGLDALDVTLWIEDIPSKTLVERPDQAHLFDPWSPMFLDVEARSTQPPLLHVVFFQRNVERDACASSPEEMARFLLEISEKCSFMIDAIVNGDTIRT